MARDDSKPDFELRAESLELRAKPTGSEAASITDIRFFVRRSGSGLLALSSGLRDSAIVGRTTQKGLNAIVFEFYSGLLVRRMSFERSPLCKLDGLTPEQRLIHIEWCLAIGMVESAVYHYRLMLPIDFLPGESEALYHRIRAAKESGWNYAAATERGPLPPNPFMVQKEKAAREGETS